MRTVYAFSILAVLFLVGISAYSQSHSILENLAVSPNYETHRISSTDTTGGNGDAAYIKPGETIVLAEIDGPGAITHIWNTINAEKYYSRMLILRFYWDGQETPTVEAPLGDFFGVGHGLNHPFQSFVSNASSEGRARNCYWFMPFKRSAKVTVTHEGFEPVGAFYYYIDYRTYRSLPDDLLYFHACYRQATPNPKVNLGGKNLDGKTNYLLMETTGRGQYVGTVLSVQMNTKGWFGEGDDMFFVDGAEKPTMTGTGTEDYFNDAWGFREFSYPYHGVSLWEGYEKGHRGTAYKWHVFDPVAFTKSLRATIEHGHANDRQDDFYSVSFWYQTLPSPSPPLMAGVFDRLPDEGQLYCKSIFLNKELALHTQEGRIEDAITRIEEFIEENEDADRYGYWSLRKGVFLKQQGELKEAVKAFSGAVEKSGGNDPRALERDANRINPFAKREHAVLAVKKSARLLISCNDSFEIFIDGKSVGKGTNWENLRDLDIKLSRGTHVITVEAKNKNRNAGMYLQLSHRSGYVVTDSSWKTSTKEEKGWNQRKFDDSTWTPAKEMGVPGEEGWVTSRQPLAFTVPFLFANAIWTPDGVKEEQTVYFRKIIRIK